MKFGRVMVDFVEMNHRRVVVRRDRHIPFSRELSAHVGFYSVQRFFGWRFVKPNRDAVIIYI